MVGLGRLRPSDPTPTGRINARRVGVNPREPEVLWEARRIPETRGFTIRRTQKVPQTICPASRQAANGTSLRVLWRGRSPGRSNAAARRKNAPTNGGMAAWKATLRCCDEVPPQESSRRAKKRMDSSTRSLLPVSMPHLFSWGFAGRRPIPTDSGFPANCAGNSCQAPDCGVFMAFRTCAARGPQTAFEEV